MMSRFSFDDIKNFIIGMSRMYIYKVTGFFSFYRYRNRALNYRKSIQNPICKSKGKCEFCGCHSEGLMYIDRKCEGSCYPNLPKTEYEWDMFCKENTVASTENIGDEIMIYYVDGSMVCIPSKYGEILSDMLSISKVLYLKRLFL